MSRAGGSHVASGLDPATSVADLELAWQEREEQAVILAKSSSHLTALSLRVYSLEIRLKARICKVLKLDYLPQILKSHELSKIIIFTGLWDELEDPKNAAVRQNWDILVDFSTLRLNGQRYLPRANLDPKDLKKYNQTLDHPSSGVLAWLARHP